MRLVKQQIERKDGSGFATLMPEEPEDMWHAYNLIRPTDLLQASAIRKVTTESAGSGARSVDRVHTVLTIRVTKLDFDPQAAQLHVSGRVAVENKHVKLGSYHTLDLELNRNFTLEKADGWDSVALDILKESIDQDAKAVLWAVIMQEGLANVCLITDHQTVLRQRIETSLPKKRAGSSDHDKAIQRFYQTTLDSTLRQIGEEMKPLLLASPGFTARNFQNFIKAQASTGTNKQLQQLVTKITVAHSASGHLHDLAQVLSDPTVTSQLSDTKFARETQLMNKWFKLMEDDEGRAWYGPRECELAIERGAVGKGGGVLLISNALFRSQEIKTRKRWVAAVDEVKDQGGEVRILSSMHESGKRLETLGDIAVILTFPISEEEMIGATGQDVDGGHDLPDDEVNGHIVEGRQGNPEDIDLF